jgi:hypothetical protein
MIGYDRPLSRPKGSEEVDWANFFFFFIDHKIGEKKHTHPLFEKRDIKKNNHQARATSVTLKSRQALNTVQ